MPVAEEVLVAFDFTACRRVLLRAVLAALRSRAKKIQAIERGGGGQLPTITGVSLDLAPWHGGVGLSLRIAADPTDPVRHFSSVEWKHFGFLSPENCPALEPIGEYIQKCCRAKGQRGSLDMAHLIFLAGADALLDKKVAAFFQEVGVDALVIRAKLEAHDFDCVVVDPDGTIKANYCELVLANRVTRRLLGESGGF